MPILGLTVAVAFVGWLAWVNVRGGSSGAAARTSSGTASETASPRASATPDPAEAEVKAAAQAWVRAYFDTYRTGNVSAVEPLTVPNSQADGDLGVPLHEVNSSHRTFLLTTLTCPQVIVVLAGTLARADIACTANGTDAMWPSLTPIQPHSIAVNYRLEMEQTGARWLVSSLQLLQA